MGRVMSPRSKAPGALARALAALAVMASVGTLGACSASQPSHGATPPAVADALSHLDTTSEPQRAVLQLAAAEGRDVTFEEYHQALLQAIDCMNATGTGTYWLDPVDPGAGGTTSFSMGAHVADPAASDAATGECFERYADLIDAAYSGRAEAVEARERIDTEYLPAVRECVRAEGVTVPDDATLGDVLDLEGTALPDQPLAQTCGCTTGLAEAAGGTCA